MIEPDLPPERTRARETLSALMDGECDHDGVLGACRSWRGDADARAQWHAYHLIGDVLRSDDLAGTGTADAAFLQSVRARLASEPVVLAPMPKSEPAPVVVPRQANGAPARPSLLRMRRWVAPVGMAAGVALVAGAVLVTRPDMLGESSLALSRPVPAMTGTAQVELVRAPVMPVDPATSGPAGQPAQVVVDAEMARYLSAHQQFPGATVLGPAPGFLRSTAYEAVPAR
jgi:sigma-E factor negative regulatory protein RseA